MDFNKNLSLLLTEVTLYHRHSLEMSMINVLETLSYVETP